MNWHRVGVQKGMIHNYLTIAWRRLLQNKAFTVINVSGLALGVACSLLILLWVKDEYSVDRFHQHRNQLYSIIQRAYAGDKKGIGYYTPGLLADEMKKTLPEVSAAVCYSAWGSQNTFRVGDKVVKEKGEFAGADFFKVFSFPLLQGNAATALNAPDKIAISRKMAALFFGQPEKALHQTIRFNEKVEFTVAAVFEDVAAQSSMQFEYLVNWWYLQKENAWINDWNNVALFTAVVLHDNARPDAFKQHIVHFLDKLNTAQGTYYRVALDMQRFDETYLHGGFTDKEIGGGRITNVWLFSILAIFILLIACINFMNLSTAHALQRAREIGVRKAAGANRSTLIGQFIAEAMLFALLAVLLAVVIIIPVMPWFNAVAHKQIQLPFHAVAFWMQLLAIGGFTGLLAGSYPAFYLSSFKPVKVLKGLLVTDSRTLIFRKGLVVFQFVLSLLLITGSIIIWSQLQFLREQKLGVDIDKLVAIPAEGALLKEYPLFKQKAADLPGVQGVTYASCMPTDATEYWVNELDWEGKLPDYKPAFAYVTVGFDIARTMGLQMVEGREFSAQLASDSTAFILNETAVKQMGYTHPVGRSFTCSGIKGKIIGVVKDYHFHSLKRPISPLIFSYSLPQEGGYFFIRTNVRNPEAILSSLQRICKQLNPGFTFSYEFASDTYQRLYADEQMTRSLNNVFTLLAIIISCLGLLGLAMFSVQQRSKEISIRKVLGARIGALFLLLSKEFLLLVLWAFCIASPIAWYVMNQWLQGYAYHIHIGWWIFALAGVAIVTITVTVISFQILKAAWANPVKGLKNV